MSKFSVKKTYTVFVAVVIVLVLGVVSYSKMTPDLLPNLDMPYVIVMTTYPGATPEKVETAVTKPLEQVMGTLENINNISSKSSENYSTIMLEFTDDVNMESITVDILQKINQVEEKWDDSVGTPYILKLNPSMMPVMVAAVHNEGMEAAELSNFVNDTLLNKLEGISGVASVSANGVLEEKINVVIDQKKLNQLNKKIRSSIDDKFEDTEKELSDAKKKTEDGKSDMQSGKDKLNTGKEQLSQKTAEAETELSGKQMEIAQGKQQINQQLSELDEKLKELETNEENLQKLQSGITQLEKAKEQLTEAVTQLETLQTTIETLAAAQVSFQQKIAEIQNNENLTEEMKNTYISQIYETDEYKQMAAGNATIEAQLKARGLSKEDIPEKIAEAKKSLTEVEEGLEKIDTSLSEMGMTRKDITNSIKEISNGKKQINAGIKQLKATLKKLEAGSVEVEDAMVELRKQKTNTIFELSDTSAKLQVGESSLESAEKEIETGLEKAKDAKKSAYKSADLKNIITMDMVSNILTAQNFSMPAGYVEQDGVNYLVSVGDNIKDLEEMKNLMLVDLKMDGVEPIYLSDVAEVFITDNSDTTYARVNENDGVLLSFSKQSNYATADVSDKIAEKFKDLSDEYEGLTFTTMMDQGDYIYMIVNSILQNLLLGAVFAVLILFLFLRDIKPTIITLFSIPISIVFAIVLMYFSGITLNIISLSGLAVAVGMLVDNSVVVIENTYRLRSKGVSAIQAAVSGAAQVAGAITSSTLTTICVFFPIVFVEGITRQLFTDMALTIAYSLLASLIIALTLVPAMAAGLLKNTRKKEHKLFNKIVSLYEKMVRVALKHKFIVISLSVVLLILSFVIVLAKGFSFMPDMDSQEITISLQMPEGSVLADTKKMSNQVIEKIQTVEGVTTVGAMLGGGNVALTSESGNSDETSVTMYALLDENTKRSSKEVAEEISNLCKDFDCEIDVSGSSGMSGSMSALGGSGVSINLYGDDLDNLQKAAKNVASALEKVEGTANIFDGLEDTDSEIRFTVNKDKAMSEGLTVAQVYAKLSEALTTEKSSTTINYDNMDYDIIVKNKKEKKLTPEYIKNYTFTIEDKEGKEKKIAIGDIADVVETETMSAIDRDNQRRYLTVSAEIADGYNVSLVTQEAQKVLKTYELPAGVTMEFSGENETIMESISQLILMIILGVVLVYLIMVAQFQSLKSPFIVMFTIPLAFTGGLFGLAIAGKEISVIALIGFVMLCGIIVNNGIVLVDYINQLRSERMEKKEAIVQAGMTRLRPILMTSITTILGLTVTALGNDSGSQMMQPIAIVCIGGLIYATLLTLFVIPVMYDIMNKKEIYVIKEEDLEITQE